MWLSLTGNTNLLFVSPLFFKHLIDDQKKQYEHVITALENKYSSWSTSEKHRKCIECAREYNLEVVGTAMHSLELCSGEEVMSEALKKVGFMTHTLDNDQQRSATSKLSLFQLESYIAEGRICDHPYLSKPFSAIWAAPECRTWR